MLEFRFLNFVSTSHEQATEANEFKFLHQFYFFILFPL